MSVRRLLAAAAPTPLVILALAPPAAAQVLGRPADALTSGRSWSLVGAALGVAGLVVGGLALARAAGPLHRGTSRRGAFVAVAAGLAAAVIGGAVVAAAEGGPGTGDGIVGGIVALGVGLLAAVLGGLALARSRRARRAPGVGPGGGRVPG